LPQLNGFKTEARKNKGIVGQFSRQKICHFIMNLC